MSRKYKFHNPDGVYFATFAVQGWVDVFTRNEYKNILADNLAYCQKNKGLELVASRSGVWIETLTIRNERADL